MAQRFLIVFGHHRCAYVGRLGVGDYVKDDDVIALIDTEAFSFEYRAPDPGVITKVLLTNNHLYLFTLACTASCT